MHSKQSLYTARFCGMGASGQKTPCLTDGYAEDICNFRIDAQGHLVRRDGYRKLCDLPDGVRGFYYGRYPSSQENATFVLVGKDLLCLRDGEETWQTLCQLPMATETGSVTVLSLSERIYILDGDDFYFWDLSTSGRVYGYIPLGFTHCNPTTGIGQKKEAHNLVCNLMRVQYTLEDVSRIFVLPEVAQSVVWVKVQGTSVGYQVERAYINAARWQINLDDSSPVGENIVEVCYQIYDSGARRELARNRRVFLYGGSDDLRVFLYGSGAASVYYSIPMQDNTHPMEYFPEGGIIRVGTGRVTGIVRRYNHLLIHTEKETFSARQEGENYLLYLVNAEIGCQETGLAQEIGQDTFTVSGDRAYRLVGTSTEGDRIAKRIDDRMGDRLSSLRTGVCCVNSKHSEIFLATAQDLLVYQYEKDAWYRFGIADVAEFFCAPSGQIGFLCENALYLFDETKEDDDGTPIEANASFAPITFGRRAPIVESAICVYGNGSARLVLKTGATTTDQLFYACAKGALQPMQTQRVRMGAADAHTVCLKSCDRVTVSFCGIRTRDGKWGELT